MVISGLNHAASASAVYASSRALPHAHARLASGRWLAFAGWELNPLDSIEKFLFVTSNFLLSQAYPGATCKNLPQRLAARIIGLEIPILVSAVFREILFGPSNNQ